MNCCCHFPTEQNQQKHWCDDIAQCLGWIAGCIFKFKTKLIFVFKALEKNPKLREKIQLLIAAGDSVHFKDYTNNNIIILPSFSICIFLPLYFQRIVGGGELSTSQMMFALSPSVNSCGEGAFLKVIFSEKQAVI